MLTVRTECVVADEVGAAPEQVRAFYSDLTNIAAVHPLVVAVHPGPRVPDAAGYRQGYRIVDRITLGPLAIRIRYWVRMTVPDTGDVIAESRQFPRVRLHTAVSFTPTAHGTRITERMSIDAPRPLAAFTVRQAVVAHREMLAGIRERFAR
ncbi:SRPBCC family protein [Mycolicibacterium phlei]